jgi:hypothetical protein
VSIGMKREEVTKDWRKLHSELNNVYSSPNTVRVKIERTI